MPRRSGGGGGMRSSSFSRAPPPRPTHTVLAAPPPPAAAVSRQPGLFGQMASIAGGVAVGSAVGHTLGAALTGGYRDQDQPVATQQVTGPNSQPLYQDPNDRCNLYQKEFIKCLDSTHGDSKPCQGFWEALKECQQHQNSARV